MNANAHKQMCPLKCTCMGIEAVGSCSRNENECMVHLQEINATKFNVLDTKDLKELHEYAPPNNINIGKENEQFTKRNI